MLKIGHEDMLEESDHLLNYKIILKLIKRKKKKAAAFTIY